MKMHRVKSSNIRSVGFELNDKGGKVGTLRVEFHGHDTVPYDYFDVPESEYEAMRDADSVGSYFARHIRNQYKWTRV